MRTDASAGSWNANGHVRVLGACARARDTSLRAELLVENTYQEAGKRKKVANPALFALAFVLVSTPAHAYALEPARAHAWAHMLQNLHAGRTDASVRTLACSMPTHARANPHACRQPRARTLPHA